jgi:hypothetical protein
MSNTPIQPYTVQTSQTITTFKVSCRSLDLFNNATFTVDSFDINSNLVSRQVIPITNDQYVGWNNNDSYIIDLMATILGYTLESPPDSTDNTVVSGP